MKISTLAEHNFMHLQAHDKKRLNFANILRLRWNKMSTSDPPTFEAKLFSLDRCTASSLELLLLH